MKSYVIHLIRHGLTEANIKGQYAGITDIPVCGEGIKRLGELKDKYKYPEVNRCYSSPLKRCLQTCAEIYPEKRPEIIDGLKECDFGDWECKTTGELSKNPEFIGWLKSNQMSQPPNGESGENFQKRVMSAFEDLVDQLMKDGETSSAIFSHGGVIMLILSLYGIPRKSFYEWVVDNGCGYSVRITPGLWMRSKVFEVFDIVPKGKEEGLSGDFKYMMDFAKNQSKESV